MQFIPHSEKQEQALLSDKPLTICATGIQWGKSTVGVVWLKMLMHMHTNRYDNFIITSPTYKVLSQSTLPVFNRFNDGIGKHDKKNECFMIKGGGTVFFRTVSDPDSVVGITNVRGILCDEAGLYSLYAWENIQARASFREAPTMVVTSPYSLNWLYRDYIRKIQSGDEYTIARTHLCQAASFENPFFPKREYEEKQRTMESRRFNMVYGGRFDKAQGLVYQNFEQTKHCLDSIPTFPAGTEFYAGIDWGFSHPFVIVVRAITPHGVHYQVDEFVKTNLMISEKIDAAHKLKTKWPIEKFFADPANPDDIAAFNRAGLRTIGAINDIKPGIEDHWSLIAQDRYYVVKHHNKHTIDEYETYHYPEPRDLRSDQSERDSDNLPVDANNHTMDANRYLTVHTKNIGLRPNRVIHSEKSPIPATTVSNIDLKRDKLLRRKQYDQDRYL
jgi:PBSX family phage terminase large subunit